MQEMRSAHQPGDRSLFLTTRLRDAISYVPLSTYDVTSKLHVHTK